ncbi:hypothetical protein EV359DRAFT_69093 [Lentinula novae-zelandiae]|nr:hypothetical protein EV359DRAFT_69093 [Lentinula novae-zelandiae]
MPLRGEGEREREHEDQDKFRNNGVCGVWGAGVLPLPSEASAANNTLLISRMVALRFCVGCAFRSDFNRGTMGYYLRSKASGPGVMPWIPKAPFDFLALLKRSTAGAVAAFENREEESNFAPEEASDAAPTTSERVPFPGEPLSTSASNPSASSAPISDASSSGTFNPPSCDFSAYGTSAANSPAPNASASNFPASNAAPAPKSRAGAAPVGKGSKQLLEASSSAAVPSSPPSVCKQKQKANSK